VSLLSSRWDQVVHARYRHQAILFPPAKSRSGGQSADEISCLYPEVCTSHALHGLSIGFGITFSILLHPAGSSGLKVCDYMVKPHEQLVLVSSRPHNPYTPSLSTS